MITKKVFIFESLEQVSLKRLGNTALELEVRDPCGAATTVLLERTEEMSDEAFDKSWKEYDITEAAHDFEMIFGINPY